MNLPYARGSETSKAAADSMVSLASSYRARIRFMVEQSGLSGLTCDDVERMTDWRHETVSARLRELIQHGAITFKLDPSGRKLQRPTRRGRNACIYVAASTVQPAAETVQPSLL